MTRAIGAVDGEGGMYMVTHALRVLSFIFIFSVVVLIMRTARRDGATKKRKSEKKKRKKNGFFLNEMVLNETHRHLSLDLVHGGERVLVHELDVPARSGAQVEFQKVTI